MHQASDRLPAHAVNDGGQTWSGGSAVRQILALLALIGAGYVVISSLAASVAAYSPIPIWDTWSYLTVPETLARLFDQHNEHRLVTGRLAILMDIIFTHNRQVIPQICFFWFQLLLAAFLIFLLDVPKRNTIDLGIPVAFIITLTFWAAQYENFINGIQIIFSAVLLFGLLAFYLVTLAKDRDWALPLAVLCSAISQYSLANGVLVPWLLVPLALVSGLSRPKIGTLVISALILSSMYFWNYFSPLSHSNPLESYEHAGEITRYTLVFLGTPLGIPAFKAWQLMGGDPGAMSIIYQASGVVVLVIALIVVGSLLVTTRLNRMTRSQLIFLALILWITASACATALGRIKFTEFQALSPRYVAFASLFLGSALLILWESSAGRGRLFAQLCMVVFIAGAVLTQSSFLKLVEDIGLIKREAAAALLSDVLWSPATSQVYFQNEIPRRTETLRSNGYSIFADPWAKWLGQPLKSQVTSMRDACLGHFDTAISIETDFGPAYRAKGWIWTSSEVPQRVVLTDETGNVVGFALSGFRRPDVAAVFSDIKTELTGWHGYLKSKPGEAISAYGIANDLGFACRLLGSHRLPPGPVTYSQR